MTYLIFCGIIINIILIPMLIINLIMTIKQLVDNKIRAKFVTLSFILLLIYFFLLIVVSICGTIKYNLIYLLFLLFVIIPFVLGRFVKYKSLTLYTCLHIVSLCLSLLGLILI